MTTTPRINGRFAPGYSGNEGGRRKKVRTVDAAILDAADEHIEITENGKRKRVTKRQAAAKRIANSAIGGDLRSAKVMLDLAHKAEERRAASQSSDERLNVSDQTIAAALLQRLKRIWKEEQDHDAAS